MKTKGKFLVGDITKIFWPEARQRESSRWPDDYYQIRLPSFSEEAVGRCLIHPKAIIEGCSAGQCGIAAIVGPRSPIDYAEPSNS